MRVIVAGLGVVLMLMFVSAPGSSVLGQQVTNDDDADDPIAVLVGRLDLERYKAVIKGLTEFGDRRQGTQRNRDAVDWIEAWLESAGCPTERLYYTYDPPPRTCRRHPADASHGPP